MPELSKLDKVFQIVIKHFIEKGQAPHYTEIATELGISTEEGKEGTS